MLKIKDKEGKLKWVLRDTDEEPLTVDEFILADAQDAAKRSNEQSKKEKKDNAKSN